MHITLKAVHITMNTMLKTIDTVHKTMPYVHKSAKQYRSHKLALQVPKIALSGLNRQNNNYQSNKFIFYEKI